MPSMTKSTIKKTKDIKTEEMISENPENINIQTEECTTNSIETESLKDKEIEELKRQISMLASKLSEITDNSKEDTKDINNERHYVEDDANKVYEEPIPTKNIKLISLYYGSLNLSDGRNSKISFDRYGQVKNCLYSKLVDIVDNNAKFAESGYFYIADKAAVYNLGLADVYKNIKPKEVLDNICDYDDGSIINICETITNEQKDELAFGLARRKFNGENLDYNKLVLISKHIQKDIIEMIKDMEKVDEANKLAHK